MSAATVQFGTGLRRSLGSLHTTMAATFYIPIGGRAHAAQWPEPPQADCRSTASRVRRDVDAVILHASPDSARHSATSPVAPLGLSTPTTQKSAPRPQERRLRPTARHTAACPPRPRS